MRLSADLAAFFGFALNRVKKAAKNEKYQGVLRTLKVEDHFSQADFELVFGGSGTLIQPTPTNKVSGSLFLLVQLWRRR
jgi:hypothetical protein